MATLFNVIGERLYHDNLQREFSIVIQHCQSSQKNAEVNQQYFICIPYLENSMQQFDSDQ